MRRLFSRMISLALCSALVGCNAEVRVDPNGGTSVRTGTDERGEGGGFSLEIPGVDVKVKDGKVDVKAPGTDVKVDTNSGDVQVDTPNTRVRRNPETGVEVDAPGTEVDVR